MKVETGNWKPGTGNCFKLSLCLVLILALFMPSASEAISLDALIDSVQERYEKLTTMTGNFTQISYLKIYKRKQVSKGVMYLKRPGKIRWEYQSPEEQLIISDGMVLWFFIPADKQVMKKKLKQGVDPAAPYLFLLGRGKLRDIFQIQKGKEVPDGDGKYSVTLKPRVAQPNMEKIIIGVNRENFQIEETTIVDYFGNSTTVTLSEIRTDREVPDKMFQFVPPEDIRIIEATE